MEFEAMMNSAMRQSRDRGAAKSNLLNGLVGLLLMGLLLLGGYLVLNQQQGLFLSKASESDGLGAGGRVASREPDVAVPVLLTDGLSFDVVGRLILKESGNSRAEPRDAVKIDHGAYRWLTSR